MRLIAKLLFLALFGLLIAVPASVFFMVEPQPLVQGAAPLGAAEVRQAQALLRAHDPRQLRDGERTTVNLSEADLALMLRYAANLLRRGAGAARLDMGRAELGLTAELPANPLGRYLNVHIKVRGQGRLPQVERVKIGRIPVPGAIADPLIWKGLALAAARVGSPNPVEHIERVAFGPGVLTVRYQWDSSLPAALRESLVPAELVASLEAQQVRLAEVTAASSGTLPFPKLLAALFAHGRERASQAPALQENRAALIVLAAYLGGHSLSRLVTQARNWPTPTQRRVRMAGRKDLAQHFAVSAAIAAVGNPALSNAIGLFKEVDDSQGGSGFSFKDLAADRAGTRFGEIAGNDDSARRLQALVGRGLTEDEVLPPIGDLPENMQEAEFRARFGSTQSDAYLAMVQRIDSRLARLALYQ